MRGDSQRYSRAHMPATLDSSENLFASPLSCLLALQLRRTIALPNVGAVDAGGQAPRDGAQEMICGPWRRVSAGDGSFKPLNSWVEPDGSASSSARASCEYAPQTPRLLGHTWRAELASLQRS